MTTLFMHVEEEPALERVPEALRGIVARALAKDPEQRFRTAMGMAQALRAAFTALAAETTGQRAAVPSRQYRIAGAAFVLIVTAVVLWAAWPRNGPPPAVAPPSSALAFPTATPSVAAPPSEPSPAPIPPRIPTVIASAAAVVRPQGPPPTIAAVPLPTAEPSPTAVAAEATPAATATPEPSPTPAPTAASEAAATAPAPSALGRLNISVNPWALVSIDGKDYGLSPVSVPLDAGKRHVVLTHEDYQPYSRWVTIVAGKTGKFSVDLVREGIRR